MNKVLYIICSGIILIIVTISFALLIAFTGNLHPLFQIDSSTVPSSLSLAVLTNIGLLSLFGLQHTIMARTSFKEKARSIIPFGLERMVYVLISAIILIIMVLFWQPIPYLIWDIKLEWLRIMIYTFFFLGWFLTASASALMNGFDLLGLRQLASQLFNKKYTPLPFRTPLIYQLVRHPLYLGFLMAFWFTPTMTLSHLIFSVGMTIYILIGIKYEERDLADRYGESYSEYQKSTPKLFPRKIGL